MHHAALGNVTKQLDRMEATIEDHHDQVVLTLDRLQSGQAQILKGLETVITGSTESPQLVMLTPTKSNKLFKK